MQSEPFMDWQRLTDLYREMYDGELLELAADAGDLTETARQVLRDEMKRRGLDERRSASEAGSGEFGAEPVDGDPPHEYTWKTPLCGCEDYERAWQLSEMLRRAGIESWIEQQGAKYAGPYVGVGAGELQVLVAADQLEAARAVSAQPIPQEIIDQSQVRDEEYEPPHCPRCRATDPTLESADPANCWLCESCGNQWTESAVEEDGKAETTEP
jgi:hypothetical protein